jgi:shikimate dehydrogenase
VISGQTTTYCLIGDPVDHSLSPFIMNRAFAEHRVDAVYVTCRVKQGRLADAVQGRTALGLTGANVTYPHKEDVLGYLSETSPSVDIIQAANTLIFSGSGAAGHNTDARGTVVALKEFAGIAAKTRRVFVFGIGGAGRAAAFGLLESGAASITFGHRDDVKAGAVVGRFKRAFPDQMIESVSLTDRSGKSALAQALSTAEIVINATPVGMRGYGTKVLIRDDAWLNPTHCCFEFVYKPIETRFLALARRRGAKTLDGVALLVAQASESFRLWTGRSFSMMEMDRAVRYHLKDPPNTT